MLIIKELLLVCVFVLSTLGDEKSFPQGNKNRQKLLKTKVVEEFVPPPPPDFIDLGIKSPSKLHTNQTFIDACKFFAG